VETLRQAREVLLDEIASLERAATERELDRPELETARRGLVEALVRIEQRIEHPS
jgi:phage terminase large subunit-like protein